MSINYMLVESNLNGSNCFRAVTESAGRSGLADVIEHMLRDDCPLERDTIERALEYFFQAIQDMVLEGRYVITPSANYRASIRGRFEDLDDGYDTDRHQVVAAACPGLQLRQAVRERARVAKQASIKPRPSPLVYIDLVSGGRNSTVTPGAPGRVRGYLLQHEPADPEQGIFFRAADGSVTRAEMIIRNMRREVIFLVPALPPGEYTLEMRARVHGSQEVRRGVLEDPLVVAGPGGE